MSNARPQHVQLGSQQMARCPTCGSLEAPHTYCYHGDEEVGTPRVLVIVDVREGVMA